jgi:hypothetical protein
MSRLNDEGPYAIGNVEIKTLSENSAEAFSRKPNKKNKGVFNILQGRERSWLSKYGKLSLGWFASEEEAVAAREKYITENNLSTSGCRGLGSGKGYSEYRGAFIAQCCGKSTRHHSKEDAINSYKNMASQEIARRISAQH